MQINKHTITLPLSILISFFLSSCENTISNYEVKDNMVETWRVQDLLQVAFYVGCLFIACAFFIAVVIHVQESKRWNTVWRWIERRLTFIFILVWIAGFSIYSVGMFIVNGGQSDFQKLISVSWMAVIHAFGMFVLDSDISAVHEYFHNNLYYMTCFSLVHFFAAFVSMIFVIKHFGYNIVAGTQLWLTSHFSRKKENLYIFWGMNKPSFFLAKDIKENAPKSESSRILFVKTADDEDNAGSRTGIDRLFNFLSVKNKELKEFKELNCLSTNAFYRLSKCHISDVEREDKKLSILEQRLGLRSVVRLLNKTSKHVHVMMLGDDEESNIKAAANIALDKDLIECADKDCQVTIHCHARYDSVNRVIEDTRYSNNLEIRIIDSSHLAVETLKSKQDELCLPVDFVRVEKDATVSSAFHSVVIGMGECGRDAIRFLYEYGAFVQHGTEGQLSSFRCDVFDKDIQNIAPRFFSARPGVDVSEVNESLYSDEWHRVNLFNADTDGSMFWQFMEDNIVHENCIFITMKDDEAGLTLAVHLLKLAVRKDVNLEQFRIFVRSYDEDVLRHMEEIANHYNRNVIKSLNLQKNKQPIFIFGKMKELYTWHHIIDESMRKESFRYYNSYEGFNEAEANLGEKWMERRVKKLGKVYPYGYGSLNEIRRMEFEDMENAWHRLTKISLIRKALEDDEDKLHELAQTISSIVESDMRHADNTYGIDSNWQCIMDTLAQTEHLRWNASHETLGYTYDKNIQKLQRDIRMQHTCLTSWNNLDKPTQGYDYQVVETSLRMYLKENSSLPN